MTLYAQWTPITYTVRFDGNGATSGTMDDLAVTYDAEATLPARRYAKANKTFTGWNTKKDGSGASYGTRPRSGTWRPYRTRSSSCTLNGRTP